MKGTVLRVVSGGAVASVLMLVMVWPASAAVTPLVHPSVDISTPENGAFFRRGSIWVTGVACDPSAAASDPTAGISSVRVFVTDRDDPTAEPAAHNGRGGYVGGATIAGTLGTGSAIDLTAVTAQTSRLALGSGSTSTCKNPNAGWRVLTTALRKGGYRLNVYTLAKNGMETQSTTSIRVDQP